MSAIPNDQLPSLPPVPRRRVVLVVGTGTDVGKTHVSCALLAEANGEQQAATANEIPELRGFKPLLSGVSPAVARRLEARALDYTHQDSEPDDACDAERHAFAQGAAPLAPLHVFEAALSPHLAARQEGKHLDFQTIVQACHTAADGLAPGAALLIETAGGLFSPCTEATTYADLAAALVRDPSGAAADTELRVLLVAPDRIGVIHDLRATLLAATSVGLAPPVVVLSAPALPDTSTGTNARELEALSVCSVAAVFPHDRPSAASSRVAAARTLRVLFAPIS